jgi:hypothetical protein
METDFIFFFIRPFGPEFIGTGFDPKGPKGQVVAKLQPHLPGAGPLPRQPTAPTIRAIVVNEID